MHACIYGPENILFSRTICLAETIMSSQQPSEAYLGEWSFGHDPLCFGQQQISYGLMVREKPKKTEVKALVTRPKMAHSFMKK